MEYQHLSTVDDEIRLLVIEGTSVGASVDEMLSCHLQHVSLANPPVYIALSYHWGVLHDTRTVLISGQRVSITASLESALKHLRGQKNQFIWADAICTYSGRSSIENLRNMRSLIQHLEEPN
jgi:Heterokaryon incompatibility protein (HET)